MKIAEIIGSLFRGREGKEKNTRTYIPLGAPGNRGYRMDVRRTCECCDKMHDCRETYREMVHRCADEKDGSVILDLG